MVRQKTISLDEKTAIIAGRMPNFSGWVRHQLLKHAMSATLDHPSQVHVAPESARMWGEGNNKCNPRHKDGLCPSCYPDGVDA